MGVIIMGYSISWVAVKRKAPEILLQELGLLSTGVMADYGREPYTGRTFPSGWFLLVFNRCEHKFIRLNMDSGQFAWLRHQQLQKGFEQAFTPDPDVVHELKEAQVERQFLL